MPTFDIIAYHFIESSIYRLFYSTGVEVLLEWLSMFSEELGIPKTLGEIGVQDMARLDEVILITYMIYSVRIYEQLRMSTKKSKIHNTHF